MSLKIVEHYEPIIRRDSKYKMYCYYGGRGAGKSVGITDATIVLALKTRENIYCGREIEKSNDDSILLSFKNRLNYWVEKGEIDKSLFKIYNDKIVFANGSVIKFVGFSEITIDNLKSSGASIVWVEEASSLTKSVIDLLIPSVRLINQNGDMPILIFSFNRKLINDPIFVEGNSRSDCYMKKINYYDNIFFNDNLALVSELKGDEERVKNGGMTQSEFNHRWLGEPYIDDAVLISTDLLNKNANFKFTQHDLYIPRFGLDIARDGKDSSVLTIMQGNKILEQVSFKIENSFNLAREVISYYEIFDKKETQLNQRRIKIFLDLTGVGYAVYDALKQLNYGNVVIGVDFGGSPIDKRYYNKRAEMYCGIKDALIDGLEFQEQNSKYDLIQELSYLPIDLKESKIKLVSKQEIKKKLGKSPDFADSLALCFAEYLNTLRVNSARELQTFNPISPMRKKTGGLDTLKPIF